MYGWAALQYQAWARGSLFVTGSIERTVVLYTDHILEFWIDDEHYFGGDLYALRKAPLVLHLQPGEHRVDARILRDVRVMGGLGGAAVDVVLEAEASEGGLSVKGGSLVLPDMADERLASSLGSVSPRNDEKDWIEVLDIQSVNVCVRLIVPTVFYPLMDADGYMRAASLFVSREVHPSGWHRDRSVPWHSISLFRVLQWLRYFL